ncbi:hypothetical protein ACFL3S_00945 [Gemmatimonadota bacterium]
MRPVDVLQLVEATGPKKNPFLRQLVDALRQHPQVGTVAHGTCHLNDPRIQAHVIHIHWPEALTKWREPRPNQIAAIEAWLRGQSRTSIVVVTIHNEHPHFRDSRRYRQLYRTVLSNAHGLIHLGEASVPKIRDRYGSPEQEHKVIPHGDYSCLPNATTKEEAREALRLPKAQPVILALGDLRHWGELNLLLRGTLGGGTNEARLVMAGRLLGFRRFRGLSLPIEAAVALHPRVHLFKGWVPERNMQLYLNAADVLFIPRLKALNSGNVSLGFTFGKVVVGPEIGVIGEVLKKTGNPVFDPQDLESVRESLRQGLAASSTDLGDRNAEFARETMGWEGIAEEHVRFYRSILQKRGVAPALRGKDP